MVCVDESSSMPFFYNETTGGCVWSLSEVLHLEGIEDHGGSDGSSSSSAGGQVGGKEAGNGVGDEAQPSLPGGGEGERGGLRGSPPDVAHMKQDCALFVVCMQRDFFSKATNNHGVEPLSAEKAAEVPGGAFYTPDFRFPIDDLAGEQALIEGVRKLMGLPFRHVVHCHLQRPRYHCSFRTCNPGAAYLDERHLQGISSDERYVNVLPPHCVEGTAGAEVVPGVEIRPRDLVVQMGGSPELNDFSPFHEAREGMRGVADADHGSGTPPLAHILQQAGVHHVFVVGMGLEYGVLEACIDAKSWLGSDTHVYVVDDCVREFNFSGPLVFSARSRLASAGVDAVQDVQSVREIFWSGNSPSSPLARASSLQQRGFQNQVLLHCSRGEFAEASKLVYQAEWQALDDVNPDSGRSLVHMCATVGAVDIMTQLVRRGVDLGKVSPL
jgi:nicotinamidase/pyrazinamidase